MTVDMGIPSVFATFRQFIHAQSKSDERAPIRYVTLAPSMEGLAKPDRHPGPCC